MKAEAFSARAWRALALCGGLLWLAASTPALADFYKWTNERGTTVLSNEPPADPKKVTDFEVILKETRRASQSSGSSSRYDATANEHMLVQRIDSLERQVLTQRIDSLERQLQAQQYGREPAAGPAPAYGGYHAPPPPPTYYPPYYPSAYYPYTTPFYPFSAPFFYSYPVSTIVVGSGFLPRHGGFKGSHGGFKHSHGGFKHTHVGQQGLIRR